jgi:hypothetical protein
MTMQDEIDIVRCNAKNQKECEKCNLKNECYKKEWLKK